MRTVLLQQLTKNPSEYPDTKAQQHAAVALRLNNTGQYHFKHGDTVSYIICQVEIQYGYQLNKSDKIIDLQDGTNTSATQRAYHEVELKADSNLEIGETVLFRFWQKEMWMKQQFCRIPPLHYQPFLLLAIELPLAG